MKNCVFTRLTILLALAFQAGQVFGYQWPACASDYERVCQFTDTSEFKCLFSNRQDLSQTCVDALLPDIEDRPEQHEQLINRGSGTWVSPSAYAPPPTQIYDPYDHLSRLMRSPSIDDAAP